LVADFKIPAKKNELRNKEIQAIKNSLLSHSNSNQSNKKLKEEETPKYRDRAKERRELHPNSYENNDYQAPTEKQEVNSALSNDNIGNKMVRLMGWKDGKGLGKHEDGIQMPLNVTIYEGKAGLGSKNVTTLEDELNNANSNDVYKKETRKRAHQRLLDILQDEDNKNLEPAVKKRKS